MNTERAKEILSAYNPSTPDYEADADVQEALALLQQDPELESWWEKEKAFDGSVRSALAGVDAPSDLCGRLLKPGKHGGGATLRGDRMTSLLSRRFLLAAAAIVAAGLVTVQILRPKDTDLANFRQDMAELCRQTITELHEVVEIPAAREWLQEQRAPIPESLPGEIVRFEGMGCKVLTWRGNDVSLICMRDGEDNVRHLFTVRREVFENLSDGELNIVLSNEGLQNRAWVDGEFCYLLVAGNTHVAL